MSNIDTRAIVEKWYKKIGFDTRYDKEFYDALEKISVDASARVEDYDLECRDGKKNLLYFLYFCDELERKYIEKGIPLELLYDDLGDFPRWLDTWSDLKGEMFLGELDWFIWHFNMKLFKLGRLQFNMANADKDIPSKGIKKGDNVIGVHIPASGHLLRSECEKSIDMAREFFEKYYPDFKYEYFTCHSWLLDEGLSAILKEGSNILEFQKLFELVGREKRDSIISFVVRWKTNRDNIAEVTPKTPLAQKIKDMALAGEDFFVGSGVIKK